MKQKSIFYYQTIVLFVLCLPPLRLFAQNSGIKTNGLFWLTTTQNIGLEFAIGPKTTIELQAAYNPWTFRDNKKMRFWLAQPEIRYWFCERLEGHFMGVHLHGAQFFGGFKDQRYDGYLAGGGITYGYDWILSAHWNIEALIGIGYARLWYDKSQRIYCEKCKTPVRENYFGPTRLALSLIYLF